jgi:hypothetical protein
MIGVNWDLKFRLQQELFNKQLTYLRDKNAKLLIRNQHLERKLHEQANNAGRRSSSRPKTVPTKKKFVKFFGFINYKLKKGWSGGKIMKLIEFCLQGNLDYKQPTNKENHNGRH